MLSKFLSITILLALLFLISCHKDADHHHHHHFEADEWLIMDGDEIVLHINKGVINEEHGTSFNLANATSTNVFKIVFKDHGKVVVPDEKEYSLNWDLDENNIAEIRVESGQHSKFEFSIFGLSAGQTNVTLKVMHGDHADFISPKIPIIVE
jgi:hypothetical protein